MPAPLQPAPTLARGASLPRPHLGPAALFDALTQAQASGVLRALDVALARFVCEQAGETASPLLAWATAWLSRHEGEGHSCWPMAEAPVAWPNDVDQPAPIGAGAAEVVAALRAAPRVVDDARSAASGHAPLVLDHADGVNPRLYLRRYWQHEQQLQAHISARVQAGGRDAAVSLPGSVADPTPDVVPDPAVAAVWLDRLFGAADPAGFDWQRLACAAALRGQLTVVTGGPGTGKTYTAARALALMFATAPQPDSLRVALAAPTGKAAARLAQAIEQAWAGLATDLRARQPALAAQVQGWGRGIGPARTLHALLGSRPLSRAWRHDARHPLPLDVLVVDEASMVHLEMMVALLAALPPQARLILLGDKDQLASVEAGAVLGDLCAGAEAGGYTPATAAALAALTGQAVPEPFLGNASALAQQTVMLRESRRFGGPIGALARAVNAGDVAATLRCLRAGDAAVAWLEPAGQGGLAFADEAGDEAGDAPASESADDAGCGASAGLQTRLLRRVLDGPAGGAAHHGLRQVYMLLRQGPDAAGGAAHEAWVRALLSAFDGCRVLAALRAGPWGVDGLNAQIEAALVRAGLLRTSSGSAGAGWYPGRPVIVTRNDPSAGVVNGDVGLALPGADGRTLRVWFQDGGGPLRSLLPSRLAQVETAFAMTVHKSQGSEFGHTVLVLPPQVNAVLTRELLYTGVTRAREALTLVTPGAGVLEAAVARRTQRASGLRWV